jgi:hypothetical protein
VAQWEEQTTRIRRGKEVEIPEEWRGKIPHRQTIHKRPSKAPHKMRKYLKYGRQRAPKPAERTYERD